MRNPGLQTRCSAPHLFHQTPPHERASTPGAQAACGRQEEGSEMARRDFWAAAGLVLASREQRVGCADRRLQRRPPMSAATRWRRHRRCTSNAFSIVALLCRHAAWLVACVLVLLVLAAGPVAAKPAHKGIKRVSLVFACHLDVVRWCGVLCCALCGVYMCAGAPPFLASTGSPLWHLLFPIRTLPTICASLARASARISRACRATTMRCSATTSTSTCHGRPRLQRSCGSAAARSDTSS